MSKELKDGNSLYETITIEKFNNGSRIKFMRFTVKCSEKNDLTKLVMDLLITISEKKGYQSYFDSTQHDPLAD
jgi:hypothetical protein